MREKCKNCNSELQDSSIFCSECGAKRVNSRITLKFIISEFTETVLGWDNKFFLSIQKLLLKPKEIIESYLTGTRKKYVSPLTFFALGMTISIILFNIFHDDYIEMSFNLEQTEIDLNQDMPASFMADSELTLVDKNIIFDQLKEDSKRMAETQESILKYFNLFSFALLPFYALLSMLVYSKRYNYGEHLVINAYLQGFLFLLTSLAFLLSIFIWSQMYLISILLGIVFYSYVFSKLHKHSLLKAFLYALKFILITLGIFIVIFILILTSSGPFLSGS